MPSEAVVAATPETVHAWSLAARDGDRAAFMALYDLYSGPVFQYLQRKVNDPHLADDLASETWERALMSLGTFNPERAKFLAWLYWTAANRVKDHYRAVNRRIPREIQAHVLVHGVSEAAPDRGPEEHVIVESQNAAVVRVLNSLPARQRDAILLTEFDGLSVHDAAVVMDVSESVVKVSKHRGLRALRARLVTPRNGIESVDVVVMSEQPLAIHTQGKGRNE